MRENKGYPSLYERTVLLAEESRQQLGELLPFFPVDESRGNGTDCPALALWPGSYALTMQEDIDALAFCYGIEGDLTIGPSDTDLDLTPLGFIREILGNLMIRDNAALTSLQGFENLTTVGGDLYFSGNAALH